MARILIAEQKVIGDLLSSTEMLKGHDLTVVDTGAAAFEAYEQAGKDQRPFDLLFTGVDMAGSMDGVDLIKKIRADEEQSGALPLPIIAASGTDAGRDRAMQAGASSSLEKPFYDVADVAEAVLERLEDARFLRSLPQTRTITNKTGDVKSEGGEGKQPDKDDPTK